MYHMQVTMQQHEIGVTRLVSELYALKVQNNDVFKWIMLLW